jgi:hypothetical protein
MHADDSLQLVTMCKQRHNCKPLLTSLLCMCASPFLFFFICKQVDFEQVVEELMSNTATRAHLYSMMCGSGLWMA